MVQPRRRGSQEYARRFENQPPDTPEIAKAAHEWLSRGLFESMLAFINQAADSNFSLRVAAYQFSYLPVLEALKAAKNRGADVRIIHDARDPDVAAANNAAITAVQIKTSARSALLNRARSHTTNASFCCKTAHRNPSGRVPRTSPKEASSATRMSAMSRTMPQSPLYIVITGNCCDRTLSPPFRVQRLAS